MQKVEMTREDRDYFKNGVKSLCGVEVLIIRDFINDKQVKKTLVKEDVEFMNKELSRQAGAVFAKILRAFKKMDFAEVQEALTGGTGK